MLDVEYNTCLTYSTPGQEMELRPGWTLHAFAETWQGNKDVQEDRYVIDMVTDEHVY